MTRQTKIRGIYRRSYRPSVEECERQIIGDWYSLCDEVRQTGNADSGYAHVMARRLSDHGIFRQRALVREARA